MKGTCPIAQYCLARFLSFFWKSLSEISAITSSLSWAIMLRFLSRLACSSLREPAFCLLRASKNLLQVSRNSFQSNSPCL
ncbi:Uncharacterised protein [Segatella copri]|nr:Uncharacterised protein [Segatella copri]